MPTSIAGVSGHSFDSNHAATSRCASTGSFSKADSISITVLILRTVRFFFRWQLRRWMTARVHLQKLANRHLGGGLKDDWKVLLVFCTFKRIEAAANVGRLTELNLLCQPNDRCPRLFSDIRPRHPRQQHLQPRRARSHRALRRGPPAPHQKPLRRLLNRSRP